MQAQHMMVDMLSLGVSASAMYAAKNMPVGLWLHGPQRWQCYSQLQQESGTREQEWGRLRDVGEQRSVGAC
jgi:hypothetical protein